MVDVMMMGSQSPKSRRRRGVQQSSLLGRASDHGVSSSTTTTTTTIGGGTSRIISLSPPIRRGTLSKPPFMNNDDSSFSNSNDDSLVEIRSSSAGTTGEGKSGVTTTVADFERRPPRREKSHDLDDEYFMGINKNVVRGVMGTIKGSGTTRSKRSTNNHYHTQSSIGLGNNNSSHHRRGGGGDGSTSSPSSSITARINNHKMSLLMIQIIGLFLVAVMCLGIIVIFQQGLGALGIVGRSFQATNSYMDTMNAAKFDPPRKAEITPELLEKLHQDNQLQHAELEHLREELHQLQQDQKKERERREQEKKENAENQSKETTGEGAERNDVLTKSMAAAVTSQVKIDDSESTGNDSTPADPGRSFTADKIASPRKIRMDDEELNKAALKRREQQLTKLRGGHPSTESSSSSSSSLSRPTAETSEQQPLERDVHIINRSPWEIQVFWISTNVIDYDTNTGTPIYQWMLMSGEEDHNVMPHTTFHFHARPSHSFAIKRYPKEDSVIYTAPEFPQDQYVVLGSDFTLDVLNDSHNDKYEG